LKAEQKDFILFALLLTIMVTVYFNDRAYARLKAVKKPGQSFSDVIKEWFPQTPVKRLRR